MLFEVLRRFAMPPARPQKPLIAIVGATGTGKSQVSRLPLRLTSLKLIDVWYIQLAVSLAERFNGEVINGDALQMYDGLPITTNKIPLEDRKGIPHHLLGCVKLDEKPWTVQQFRNQATVIIEGIRSRNRLPILVGGTHYYTQSLLFKDAVLTEAEIEHIDQEEQKRRWPILDASTEDMLEELRRVDPIMAQRWHPKERRKIRRSLEIWLTTGRKASEVYDEQRQNRNSTCPQCTQSNDDPASSTNGLEQQPDMASQSALRCDTLIFWTHANPDVLNARLEKRVDAMVSDGLLSEIESIYKSLLDQEQRGILVDQTRGIWVAIGFKENLAYIINGEDRESLKKEGIERTKIATRQYAKRQIRWIKLRLQRAIATANSSHRFFVLDTADLTHWPQDVEKKARDIIEAFLSGCALPKPESLSDIAKEVLILIEAEPMAATYCEACDKTLMSKGEWVRHLKSKGHRSAVRPRVDWEALYPKDNHK